MNILLEQLIDMSRRLGDPADDLAILGEGNTSVRADAESFWVKASGAQLAQADADSFVRVRFAPVLESLERSSMNDDEVRALLTGATCEGSKTPSIETFLHALCLQLPEVRFVGHTHPTAAVGLLCSRQSRELFDGSLFPDQIVLLGSAYAYVPYTDPGLPLALAVRTEIERYQRQYEQPPRVILMENHGAIALGSTPQAVLNITQMLVKTCRILGVALQAGGPRFLSVPARSAHRPPSRRTRAAQEAVVLRQHVLSIEFVGSAANSFNRDPEEFAGKDLPPPQRLFSELRRRALNCEDASFAVPALGIGVCRVSNIRWSVFFGRPLCVAVKRSNRTMQSAMTRRRYRSQTGPARIARATSRRNPARFTATAFCSRRR